MDNVNKRNVSINTIDQLQLKHFIVKIWIPVPMVNERERERELWRIWEPCKASYSSAGKQNRPVKSNWCMTPKRHGSSRNVAIPRDMRRSLVNLSMKIGIRFPKKKKSKMFKMEWKMSYLPFNPNWPGCVTAIGVVGVLSNTYNPLYNNSITRWLRHRRPFGCLQNVKNSLTPRPLPPRPPAEMSAGGDVVDDEVEKDATAVTKEPSGRMSVLRAPSPLAWQPHCHGCCCCCGVVGIYCRLAVSCLLRLHHQPLAPAHAPPPPFPPKSFFWGFLSSSSSTVGFYNCRPQPQPCWTEP